MQESTSRPTILVTGATGSLGRALCVTFRDKGWRVFAASRTAAKVEALAREVEGVTGFTADIRSERDVKGMMDALGFAAGELDLLVNNGAVGWFEPVETASAARFEETLVTNVVGTFLCCREALPLLRRAGGTVINISSVAGEQGYPGLSGYCASKFAIMGFSQAFAEEVRPYGVKVLALCPGIIGGGLSSSMLPPLYKPADARQMMSPECVAGEVFRIATAPPGLWLTRATIRSFPGGW